ncbi:MAG TPA: DUF3617 domain-containing protein [Terracidiphilus sp.]
MRLSRTAALAGVAVLVLCVFAWAQSRKPGLWEVTSTMSWEKSPFPAGMGAHGPMGGGPHTTQVCVTQEQIDKFGGPQPQTQRDCQVTNVQKKPNGMSAEMTCSGAFSGKGTIEGSWTDDSHSHSKIHFVGAMTMGANTTPIEWTVESTSIFKGSDCGNVKPFEAPKHK